MGYHFSKFLFVRMPVFPTDFYQQPIADALAMPIFQAAIYLASPQFYERLQKADFDPANMTPKELNTVIRYYNRACYRSTPFGYFASVNMGEWSTDKRNALKDNEVELSCYIQPAESWVQSILNIATDGLHDAVYEPNPTLYRVKKSFRFVRAESDNHKRRTYHLQSSLYSLVLKGLLKFCRNGQSQNSIIAHICREAYCDEGEGREYFEFLKDAQILLPKRRPSITGNEPHILTLIPGTPEYYHRPLLAGSSLRALDVTLRELLTDTLVPDDKCLLNTILIRHNRNNSLHEKYQHDIRNALYVLERVCPADQIPSLANFKTQFQKHFEGERIPLLLALDPELGIGYQSEPFESPNPLLETVNIRPRGPKTDMQSWTTAHRCLMAAWLKMEKQQNRIIDLQENDLPQLPDDSSGIAALGASILFQVSDAGLIVESAGGCNSAALIGRFTLAESAIFQAAKEMAMEIEHLNPDLIFAEILHLAEPHIDNVNRRGLVWQYQLPLLAASDPELPAYKLRLDDLYVQVAGNKVILWSKKHRKIVIPRLTSAYNHGIDQLPLFRFLADLNYQYGRTQLSFELNHFFPGLTYYPRVVYQGAIISLATWIISSDDLTTFQKLDERSAFKSLCDKYGLPVQFIVAEGDQQLIINQWSLDDIHLFAEMVRPAKQMVVKEYIPVKSGAEVVQTDTGNQYQVQFNAFLLPDEQLYISNPNFEHAEHGVEQRKFVPGTEWLYLKLYVPRLSVNRLLLQLQPVINKRFPNGKISRWFFVRYEDHAPHIRLRFKIDPLDVEAILAALRLVLEDNVHQHLIREYQLDVYSRELERYQAIGIVETEEFFWHSSNFVLQYLKTARSGFTVPTFLVAAYTVKVITEGFYHLSEEQLSFWQHAFEQYVTEFEGEKLKVNLDLKYRETSKALNNYLLQDDPFPEKQILQSLKKLKVKAAVLGSRLEDDDVKTDYLISLIHLHVNRLFTDQQREQEMVLYYLLSKWMRSQMARQKHQFKQIDQF